MANEKIPCGGFILGDGLEMAEDGKTLNVTGGGGGGEVVTLYGTTVMQNGKKWAKTSGPYYFDKELTQKLSKIDVAKLKSFAVTFDGVETSDEHNIYVSVVRYSPNVEEASIGFCSDIPASSPGKRLWRATLYDTTYEEN